MIPNQPHPRIALLSLAFLPATGGGAGHGSAVEVSRVHRARDFRARRGQHWEVESVKARGDEAEERGGDSKRHRGRPCAGDAFGLRGQLKFKADWLKEILLHRPALVQFGIGQHHRTQ